jgi:ParB family chromosome partitioning protein
MKEYPALRRLIAIAKSDTGQSKLVANFLLAWHNAEEGGWDPTELWGDAAIADDILATLSLIRSVRRYPGDYTADLKGPPIRSEMECIWSLWRTPAFSDLGLKLSKGES